MIEILIICLILVFFYNARKDGLVEKPTREKALMFANELIENKNGMRDYNTARKKFGWMDPVIYESLRSAVKTGGFEKNNLASVIMSE